jgi:hypothetical protein
MVHCGRDAIDADTGAKVSRSVRHVRGGVVRAG